MEKHRGTYNSLISEMTAYIDKARGHIYSASSLSSIYEFEKSEDQIKLFKKTVSAMMEVFEEYQNRIKIESGK